MVILFTESQEHRTSENGFCVIVEGMKNAFFRHYFSFLFSQTQASSDGVTRIYAQPKMIKNGKKKMPKSVSGHIQYIHNKRP